MTKATYLVNVSRKGRERDFVDFWRRGLARNAAGETLSAELVGFVEPVRASNRREAAVLARRRYPDLVVAGRVARQEK